MRPGKNKYTRIVCPVDFSAAAINAVEYAAKIAQKFSAKLLLLNVRPLLYTELVGGNADVLRENVGGTRNQLNDICTETNKMLHVSCEGEAVVSYSRLEKIIGNESTPGSLIVMGTNGVDDLYQYFFGTHTFNVIKSVKCPLMLVPEKVSYFTITEFLYVWDYKKPGVFIEQAVFFAKQFEANLCLVYVSKDKAIASEERYRAAVSEMEELLNTENIIYSFEYIYSEDVVEGIDQRMAKTENSVLVVSVQQETILELLFKENLIKKLSAAASYPVIFIHGE